jgi:hypothetical protein
MCSMTAVKEDPKGTGDLADALLSIGQTKLGIQAAVSVGYDTQALGLMAVAVALAGVDVALVSHLGILWWLPLPAFAASLAISVVSISQPEIETGQNLSLAIVMDGAAETRHRLLLSSLAGAIEANIESLANKRMLVTRAIVLIGAAFVLFGAAQLAPVLGGLVA